MIDDRTALRERIREANDIVAVVGSYVALKPAGPLFKCLCPFHDDHNPSCTVDPRRQRFKCWACGKGGMSSNSCKGSITSIFEKRWNFSHVEPGFL